MTTPNIVPRFNEEGRVGREGRRFIELHGKNFFADSLILNLPQGEVIIQAAPVVGGVSWDITDGALIYSSLSELLAANTNETSNSSNIKMWDPSIAGVTIDYSASTPTITDTTSGWADAGLNQAQLDALISAVSQDSRFPSGMPISGGMLYILGAQAQPTVFPPQHHVFYRDGRLHQGDKTFAWTSEVEQIKVLVDAITSSDGSDGLSTLISQLSSLPNLDTFVELAAQVQLISDDYVTAADISSVGDISTLSTKVVDLETLTATDTVRIDTALNNILSVSSRSDALEAGQSTLNTFMSTGADSKYSPKGTAGAEEFVNTISVASLISLITKLTDGTTSDNKLAKRTDVLFETDASFDAAFEALAQSKSLLTLNSELSTSINNKLNVTDLSTQFSSIFDATFRQSLDLPTRTSVDGQVAVLTSSVNEKLSSSEFSTQWAQEASTLGYLDGSGVQGLINTSTTALQTVIDADIASLNTTLSSSISSNTSNIATKLDTSGVNSLISSSGLLDTAAANSLIDGKGFLNSSAVDTLVDAKGFATASALTSGLSSKADTSALSSYVTSSHLSSNYKTLSENNALYTSLSFGSDLNTKLQTANVFDSSGNAVEMATLSSANTIAGNVFNAGISSFEDDYDTKLAGVGLDLDSLSSTGSINWSAYTLNLGTLAITSTNTFTCADPNIELNVGQSAGYLNEVAGGITWKRGEETYDSAILWDETNKYFHVRIAGPNTYRLLTVQDSDSLNARIDSEVADLNTSISTLTSLINTNDTVVGGRIDLESQNRESADTQLQSNIDALSSSISSEVSTRASLISTIQASINAEAASRSVEDSELEAQIGDLNSLLNSSLESLDASLTTDIQSIQTSLANNVQAINSNTASAIDTAKIEVNSRTDSELADLKSELSNSIDSNLNLISEHITAVNPYNIDKTTVGLSNVENQALSSWSGSTNIGTVGTITQGTWNADPIELIANSSIRPNHIDSSTDSVYSVKNLNVTGQISVAGQALQVDTTEVNIGDNIIRLNADVSGIPTENAGFEVERGDSDNVSVLWKEHEQEWSIGNKPLETSGIKSEGSISIDSDLVVMNGSLEVAHIDITSNDSFNTTNGVIALNTDVRFPRYPWVGVDDASLDIKDPAQVTESERSQFESSIDSAKVLDMGTTGLDYAVTDSANVTDAGLKVVLGGYDTSSSSFNYAWLFWDVSANSGTGRWRLSESAPTTEELDGSTTRTEFVDTSKSGVNTFDVLHAGHIGATLNTGDITASQVQAYNADLAAIAGLSSLSENDFIVRGSSGWVKKTAAEVKTLLNVTEGAVLLTGTQTIAGSKTFSSTIQGDISGNAATVNSLTVQTAVPSGAIFTDTTYSVGDGGLTQNNFTNTLKSKLDGIESAATADQNKSDIDALGINAASVSGFTVGVNVPSDAVFTDTDTNTTYSVGDGGLTQNNFTNTLKSKLDGIEAGATADQSKSDIDSLGINATSISGFTVGVNVPSNAVFIDTTYSVEDGGLSQNNFTNTLKSKLDGIEAGATADQSKSDIDALNINAASVSGFTVGVNVPSNAVFTDTDTNTTYSVGDGGLTQNNFTDTLKSKLDGVEAGATADQTKSDIDSLGINASSVSGFTVGVNVPSNAVFTDTDTNTTYSVGDGGLTQNNFTDTLKSKLDGIEASADVNRTLAELNALALDATTVDGHTVDADVPSNAVFTDTNTTYSVGDGGLTQNNFTNTLKDKLDGIASEATKVTEGSGVSIAGNGQLSVNADQSGTITKINVASLFAKGSSWDRSSTTSGSDTTVDIALGYTTDSHSGPWKVYRQTKLDGSNLAFMDVSYKISSGVDQYKSLPDLNFTLTSSSSNGDNTHSLTLA